jgi:hypothetical protein
MLQYSHVMMQIKAVEKTMDFMFREDERTQFKAIFTRCHAFNTRIKPGINGNPTVVLKDFRVVWKHFGDAYDETNTLLIDASPSTAFANPEWSSLFPTHARHSDVHDSFLTMILWPFLQLLYASNDVRCFLRLHTPKWSLLNECRDKRKRAPLYAQLHHYFPHKIWESKYFHTILDVGKDDISWDTRDLIQHLGPLEKLDDKRVKQVAALGLGADYFGIYKQDPRKFLKDVLQVRDSTKKFLNSHTKDACLRDRKIDKKGRKFTCTNVECKLCLENTEYVRIKSAVDFTLKMRKRKAQSF